MENLIVVIILVVVVLIFLKSALKFVPQGYNWTVERW